MQINIYTIWLTLSSRHDFYTYRNITQTAVEINLRPGAILLKQGDADQHIHNMVNPFPPDMISTHTGI
ncbi:hypothetical protein FKM82_025926 [Ascaphus truei]